jgi:hypothetical protein
MRYTRMLDSAGYPKAEPARAAAPATKAPLGRYSPEALPPSK